MFLKTYALAAALMLALTGAGLVGCPPDNNGNGGAKVQFTVVVESLIADAHFAKVFAVTHNNSVRVFRENQPVGSEFQEFNFMNDTALLEPLIAGLAGVTDVVATEEDLSGLGTTNTTLTFTISGMTDDLFTIITPQFQTASTFAALNAVGLPATGSQTLTLGMFSLDQDNKVVNETDTIAYVRVTITRN